jgi:hypothetical protein
LTDAALRSIGKLTRLRSLSLPSYVATQNDGRMQFSADALTELRDLRDLETLELTGHAVTPEILDYPRMRHLNVGHWKVDDSVAEQIGKLSELRSLGIADCRLGDDGMAFIAALPHLESLSLRGPTVTDGGIAKLRSHHQLQHIDLRCNRLTDKSLGHLANIGTLTRIDLSGGGTPIGGPQKLFTAEGLLQLKELPRLETLWLSGLELANVRRLAEFKHLRSLSFIMTPVMNADLDALEEAMPETAISYATGGGMWMPRRMRQQFSNRTDDR